MGDDTTLARQKLLCECCRIDKALNDIWWCSLCQGTVCGTCAMKGHREHQCKPWENLDVVRECVQFYQSFIGKCPRDNDRQLESIRAFCTNLENHLVDFINQETKAREGLKRITEYFSLLSDKDNDDGIQRGSNFVPQKIEKKLRIVSKFLEHNDQPGLNDLAFDVYDDKRDCEFQLPKLEKVIDLCFVQKPELCRPSGTTQQEMNQIHHYVQFNFKSWLLPIMIALVITFLHPLILTDPLYSMQMTSKHNEQRRTHSLHIAYYVKADFVQQFTGDLSTLEQEIEESFVDSLRVECFNERKTKENSMWKSKINRDMEGYDKAKYMKTPNCEKLSDLLINKL